MGRSKHSRQEKLENYRREFGIKHFAIDKQVFYCKLCETAICCEKKSQVKQHLETEKHRLRLRKETDTETAPLRMQLLTNTTTDKDHKDPFSKELCSALVASGIPIYKVNNPAFKSFLGKWTNQKIPDESTLRKNYLPMEYDSVINCIRTAVGEKNIWLSVDETTDVEGRMIGNVLVGCLDGKISRAYLIHCSEMERANHTSIGKLVNEAMQILYPTGVQFDRVLLMVTDAAAYMIKAGIGLQTSYPKMVHLTCLAHGVQRVAEEVRGLYPDVDQLISNVKKIFIKAPLRVQDFHKMFPELSMPPEPVLTRWGTWLCAANYYAEHHTAIRSIVNTFDEEDAVAIKKAKQILENNTLFASLAYIKANFTCLISTIKSLESGQCTLVESIAKVQQLKIYLDEGVGPIEKARQKFCKVIDKNPGYSTMFQIAEILNGIGSTLFNSDV